ncbi:AMP-binding protein, partial [Streptomyces gramineus]|uniref:AMP-binding protein n=1 Tax=Streptomyces gramineus TaxID=910542 RepID=UPI00398AAF76
GELNERANRLAHVLVGRGVGPEDVVAVALPRGVELVVAVLAVLKAGAAYLPLDPEYPVARVAHMVGDAGPVLVLTASGCGPSAEAVGSTPVLLLDVLDVSGEPSSNPVTALVPDHPAYVIYTSGSTGRPKGVV